MAGTAKKGAWLSVGLWVITALIVWRVETTRASKAAEKATAVDGGPVQVDIDPVTCKVTPDFVALDFPPPSQWARTDRPNHYEVRWKVAFAGRPEAARVRILHDLAKSKGAAGFEESYEIDQSAGEVLSGIPHDFANRPSYWAYSVQVLSRGGEPLCPAVDPGLCFPGMGGDCGSYHR